MSSWIKCDGETMDRFIAMAWFELQHSIYTAGARTSFTGDVRDDDEQRIEREDEMHDAVCCPSLYLMQTATAASSLHNANWIKYNRIVYRGELRTFE